MDIQSDTLRQTMDYVKQAGAITSELTTNAYNWFGQQQVESVVATLSDNEVLNIANEINALFNETNLAEDKPELSLPRLAVVGTQSSGKSSCLNAIIGMDILPTGKNMVTRTPLDIRLHKLLESHNEGWVEFGHYEDGWIVEAKITITVPLPTASQIQEIRDQIAIKTVELAGEGMNICATPIIINIYSPNVPNLSLIDLPGLTQVACVDKGQPVDIKQKIEELVVSYIQNRRTIVLTVMAARPDLETDQGLALVKKHDGNGQRTIGILTKPDLMNYEAHVGDYLLGNISQSLKLMYGYYVVRNRSNTKINILEGLDEERKYFAEHDEYSKSIYKDFVGIPKLTNNLCEILVESITELIPSVMAEIVALETRVHNKLDILGSGVPESKDAQLTALNKYVNSFYQRFLDSIESRGTQINTGKIIKDTFVCYREKIKAQHPFFEKPCYNEQYFREIVSSFEGNHMSFYTPPIQILEACMGDRNLRPIMTLREPSLDCVDQTCHTLMDLIRAITRLEEFAKYPLLAAHIMGLITENIIGQLKLDAKQRVIHCLEDEEAYVWTDDPEFELRLIDTTQQKEFNETSIKKLLDTYFQSVKNNTSHNVPKIIMHNIIREIEMTLLTYLIQNVVSEDNLGLLCEDEQMEQQRKYYSNLRDRITSVKKTFSRNASR